jgi:hypothetical protein
MKKQFFSWRQAILEAELQPTSKHVLLTLACHMNDAGESCYPSIELLCRETGLSNRTVITHLQIATEEGWIKVDKHGFAGRQWARNEYRISWPEAVNEVHDHASQGSERGSPPYIGEAVKEVHHPEDEAVNLTQEGSEPDDNKAVKEVHTISSKNSSMSTPTPAAKKINGRKSGKITFRTYHDDCKAKGIKLIPENHGVFKYAKKMNIDSEMLYAAWYEFKHDHMDRNDKKQLDWPKVFLVYVRKNYLRIWNVDHAGSFTWSNKGHQTRKAMKGDVEGDL